MSKIFHRFSIISFSSLVSLGFLSKAMAANLAGVVIIASGSVHAVSSDQQQRVLSRGSNIYSGDEIKTASNSEAQLRFTDKGMVTLKSNADYRVDQYEYKPHDKKSQQTATLIKGKMLALTGYVASENPKHYRVESKLATIAITGTYFATEVQKYWQTLKVFHGTVIFSTKAGSILVGDKAAFHTAVVRASGGPPVGMNSIVPSLGISNEFRGGIYLDVGLSRDDLRDELSKTFYYTTVDVGQSAQGAHYLENSGIEGWGGSLGVGYQWAWKNGFSLSLEAFGDVSSAQGKQLGVNDFVDLINGEVDTSMENLALTHTVGVSILPGYYVAPGSLFFLDFAYVNSEFRLQGFPQIYSASFAYPSRELNDSGFRFGFGARTQIGSHFALTQEYIWENYANFNAVTAQNNVPFSGLTLNISNVMGINPENEKYKLAAVFYFASQTNPTDLSAPSHVGGHFYVGLNGSRDEAISQGDFRQIRNIQNINGAINSDSLYSENGFMKIYGWNIGILGGYGFNFVNRWHLGLEILGDWDDVSGSFLVNTPLSTVTPFNRDPASFGTTFVKHGDFNLALMPGYQVSDEALIYARVGYIGGQFEIRNAWNGTNTSNTVQAFTDAQNALLSHSIQKWLSGLQLGVGVDTFLNPNLSLRTEFDINNYGNFVMQDRYSTTAGNTTTNVQVSTEHRNIVEDSFNFALIWHFIQ